MLIPIEEAKRKEKLYGKLANQSRYVGIFLLIVLGVIGCMNNTISIAVLIVIALILSAVTVCVNRFFFKRSMRYTDLLVAHELNKLADRMKAEINSVNFKD
jgi:hypothetical protein